jgi:uncharacterized protein YukE
MKQSYLTGKRIYETLSDLYQEANDLVEALEMIEDEIGNQSKAHGILKRSLEEKRTEIAKYEARKFLAE